MNKKKSGSGLRISLPAKIEEDLEYIVDALNCANPTKVTTKASFIRDLLAAFIKDNKFFDEDENEINRK